jgi:hypothetical protein
MGSSAIGQSASREDVMFPFGIGPIVLNTDETIVHATLTVNLSRAPPVNVGIIQ